MRNTILRLHKAFDKVNEDKMHRLLQSVIEEYIKSVDSGLSTLKPKDDKTYFYERLFQSFS